MTTQSFDVLAHAMRTISAACEASAGIASRVLGIHLEGPYLSREDGPRGAHPAEFCKSPDLDEFQRLQEAAGGQIRILTLSPEYEGSAEFIAKVARSGVVVAIGHTAADSDQIRAAVDSGATLSTHLGNGAHGMLRRHPNYVWDQLAEDRLTASLIVDGHHLPSEVVKTFVRAKTSERCILVSDMSGWGGLASGRYRTSLCELEVLDDGRIVVAGQRQYLAGASRPLSAGVANVMRFAGVELPEAVEMASARALRLIGEPATGLAVGQRADFVVFDLPADDQGLPIAMEVRATIAAGKLVYGETDDADR